MRRARGGGGACAVGAAARAYRVECATVLPRIAWRTVAGIVTRVVTDGRDTVDPLSGLVSIGIDEIADHKGHRYQVVVDHQTGRLVWAAEGRNHDTLGKVLRPAGRRAGHAAHPRQLRRRAMDPLPGR
jgi:transposase